MSDINNAVLQKRKIIGVVLAGGSSSRMGTDKALLELNAKNMISRAIALFNHTQVDDIAISRNDGQDKHFKDIIPDKGPLSGVHSIATRFPYSDLVILPVDLPFMDARSIQTLITVGSQLHMNCRFQQNNLPLFLKNTFETRQKLEETLNHSKRYSLGHFCSHFAIHELNVQNTNIFFNTNTPQQWQEAVEQLENYTNNIFQEA